MTRDLSRLGSARFDLLVIGGGAYGLSAAYDAAQRGLSVALIDRADLGGASSSNHLKTAHGGLGSLQSGDLRRARQSIRERRALARIAPHHVAPLPFLIATGRSPTRGRLAMRAAFRLDRFLARERNRDVETALHLPAGQVVSRAVCLRLFPGLDPAAVTGGAMWYDYQIHQAERLNVSLAKAAAAAGACLANHVEAIEPLRDGTAIAGVKAIDALTGERIEVSASVTLNAAGAHAGAFMAAFGARRELPLLKAMNLVTSIRSHDMAIGAPAPSGRLLFLVPWRGRLIAGTSHSSRLVSPSDASVTDEELAAFIAEVNGAFPHLRLARDQVTLVHRAVVPAVTGSGGPRLKSDSEVVDHAREGIAGALSVIGATYTSARATAEQAIDLVFRKLQRPRTRCRTAVTPLPGADIADFEAILREAMRDHRVKLAPDASRHLATTYGADAAVIVPLIAEDASLGQPVAEGTPVMRAEIVHAVRNEMALTLTDAVVRRTALGAQGHPGDAAARACAELMAGELGWSSDRLHEEIASLQRFYLPVGPLAARPSGDREGVEHVGIPHRQPEPRIP
jgi:glycerol-3-phosphate dehydrogenase